MGKNMNYKLDLSRSELTILIDEWILNEKYRAIMKRRLLDGVTYERIAEEFDLSDNQVKRIVYKCTDRLVSHLPKEKLNSEQKCNENVSFASC